MIALSVDVEDFIVGFHELRACKMHLEGRGLHLGNLWFSYLFQW